MVHVLSNTSIVRFSTISNQARRCESTAHTNKVAISSTWTTLQFGFPNGGNLVHSMESLKDPESKSLFFMVGPAPVSLVPATANRRWTWHQQKFVSDEASWKKRSHIIDSLVVLYNNWIRFLQNCISNILFRYCVPFLHFIHILRWDGGAALLPTTDKRWLTFHLLWD